MNLGVRDGRGWADWHWKAQGLGLIGLGFLSFYPAAFHWQEYLFFVLLFVAAGVALYQGHSVWIRTPVDLPLALLVGWILITIPFSIDPAYSVAEWRKLAARVAVFYWALLVLHHNSGTDCWRHVTRAMLVGVSTMSLYAIIAFIQAGGTLVDMNVRAMPPYAGSPWLATYVVIMAPVVVACYVWARSHWEKAALGGILCLLILAGFFAYSRGAWLALAVMGLGVGAMQRNRKIFIWAMISVALIVSVLFVFDRLGYFGFSFHSIVDRLACSVLVLEEWRRHPIVGVGFGGDTFAQLYPDPPGLCLGNHSHNTFLLYAMGSGTPALAFLLWSFAAIFKQLSQDVREGRRTEAASIKQAGALAVLGYGVAIASNDMFAGSLVHLCWMLVAVGLSLPRQEERPVASPSS